MGGGRVHWNPGAGSAFGDSLECGGLTPQRYLQGVAKVRINPEHGPAEREIADRFDVQGYPRFYVIRTPSSAPRNLQPFRRGGSFTAEQFAIFCQDAAPSPSWNKAGASQSSPVVVNETVRNTRSATKGEVGALPVIVKDAIAERSNHSQSHSGRIARAAG